MLRSTILCVALVGLLAQPALAQNVPTQRIGEEGDGLNGGEAARSPRAWLVLPHLYYTPETGLAGGGVVGYYHGGGLAAHPSSTLSSLTITAHRQVMAEVNPEVYLDGGRIWVMGRLQALKYPDVFYGIGNTTTAGMEEGFTSRSAGLQLQVQRAVATGNWVGLRAHLQHETLLDIEEDRLLAGGGITGAEGGRMVGVGVVATRDTRDRSISPRTGVLAEARWTGFTPMLGSDYRFGAVRLDARRFVEIRAGVLALRMYVEAAQGDVPFNLLPRIGGPRLLRGYRDGRFRDNLAGVFEGEYRWPIAGRLGGVAFGGVGDVASGLDGVSPVAELARAAGAGVRFRVNPAGVNIRIDWARGREHGGLYIGLGEAF